MLKRLLLTGCRDAFPFFYKIPVRNGRFGLCCIFFFLWLWSISLHAEGSKELCLNGGYRTFLFSSPTGNLSFPFPTLGTMKVYVNAGETIYAGSSAQGMGYGAINFRAPDGTAYTSGSSTTVGLIANRNQEIAGPQPNAGGYMPYSIPVKAGQTGVWEIDFISQSNGVDYGNPDPIPANAAWAQPQGQYIAAFDISVRDAGNTKFLTGRVFTNIFSGILGTFNVGFNGIFNILTDDGYQYTLNNNGQAGNGYTFFVNNKGFRNTDGTAAYKSIDTINNPNIQDPRVPDTGSDITYKIFFNTPATDLPASAKTPEGISTWLLTKPTAFAISNVIFKGIEGTIGKAGTNPLGSNFSFTSSGQGTYTILIDVNQNGVFTDAVDRKLTGPVTAGNNLVYWDGLDGQGNKVPADPSIPYNAQITLTTKAGEVHFPYFDVERNVNGLLLTRTNGVYAPEDTVYWDDSQITIVGTPPNPIVNLTGISSLVNGHKWGTPTTDPFNQDDFGNNKGIDTWAFISNPPVVSSVSFELQQADLAVDTIATNVNCAGQPVIYTVTLQNNGPSDVDSGKFTFNFPAEITNINVSSSSTAGTSSVTGGIVSANSYKADIAMDSGSVTTFTISGLIAISATGSLDVSASILRPADVTDPDATNPADTGTPTDPTIECDAAPSGPGCNNIKTNSSAFRSAPDAGPDQTVLRYATVNLAASGQGSWTQAAGDPSVAVISNPAAASTAVTGLNNLGKYHFVYANSNDCADTVVITVVAFNMVIPNIFTPNNDGVNDLFIITGLESYPGSALYIFNRWGNEVYKADDYLNSWDGSGLPEGTYYYILKRRESTGDITIFKGWVFLKRSK
jgi:gliding motility-associated-like protein